MAECSPENLDLCGEPTFEFTNMDKICEEGSLTIILAIISLVAVFVITYFLYYLLLKGGDVRKGIIVATKHTTTGSRLSQFLENSFVKPFIPTSLESYIAVFFFWWFLLTIPMAITRFYDKKWEANTFTQHSLFNLISQAIGCGTVNLKGITYTSILSKLHPKKTRLITSFIKFLKRKKRTDYDIEEGHFKEIDFLFTLHLGFALAWLTIGFMQIFWAKSGWSGNIAIRKNAHKWFGRLVALPSLVIHVFFSLIMALKNPVNQIFSIQFLYIADLADMIILTLSGVREAIRAGKAEREGDLKKAREHKIRHKHDMVYVYIRSTMGSGAIRLTVWFLWMIGKFFPFETRIRIDRGACQTHANMLGSDFIGLAEQCWEPVFLNLALMKILLIWLYWLFLCVQKQKGELGHIEENAVKVQFSSAILTLCAYAIALRYDWAPQYWIIVYSVFTKVTILHETIVSFLSPLQPGENDSILKRKCKVVFGEFPHPKQQADHEHQH